MKFRIKYALGGGFGGTDNKDWEYIDADSLAEAQAEAEIYAREEYETYEGNHGIMSAYDIEQENPEYTEDDVEVTYNQEVDSWIEYEAEEV